MLMLQLWDLNFLVNIVSDVNHMNAKADSTSGRHA